MDDDLELLENLLQVFADSPAGDIALRCIVLHLSLYLTYANHFPLERFDARSTPWTPSLHVQRDQSTPIEFWWSYLMLKAFLRDPTVIPEITATWQDPGTADEPFYNSVTRLRMIHGLGSVGSETTARLLSQWLGEAHTDRELHAIQFELILLDWPVDPLPQFEPEELASDSMAALAESYRTGTPHPELVRVLNTESPYRNSVRHQCSPRPHLRRLCRGPADWATNLLNNLSR